MCKTKIYYETKIKEGCDKKMYPKLVLNILKVIKASICIYTLKT
jgi:hypothetical protein